MLSTMDGTKKRNLAFSALPQEVSIAGEWYLTIPAYSAAEDVGLGIIKLLTSHEAELSRLSAGIGLPTRSSFYTAHSDNRGMGDDIRIDARVLERVVGRAFPRSYFDQYAKIAGIITTHLQRIIELPGDEESQLEKQMRQVFADLSEQVSFIKL